MKLQVIIEQDETGYYVAEVPALPGCVSQGRTIAENNQSSCEKGKIGNSNSLPPNPHWNSKPALEKVKVKF